MQKFYWMVTFREGTETERILWIGLGKLCRPSAKTSRPWSSQGHVLALTFNVWPRLLHWQNVKCDLTNHSLYVNWWDYRGVQLFRFPRYSNVRSCAFLRYVFRGGGAGWLPAILTPYMYPYVHLFPCIQSVHYFIFYLLL
jgi:hypothetical protein